MVKLAKYLQLPPKKLSYQKGEEEMRARYKRKHPPRKNRTVDVKLVYVF